MANIAIWSFGRAGIHINKVLEMVNSHKIFGDLMHNCNGNGQIHEY